MSTAYNRRRGASARKIRNPRQCEHTELRVREAGESLPGAKMREQCMRLAPRNRYCDDHQRPHAAVQVDPARRGGHPGELSRKVRPGILERARKRWRRAYREWKAGRRA